MSFKFELKQAVQNGIITGRAEYTNSPNHYLVNNGEQELWFAEVNVQPLIPVTPPKQVIDPTTAV